MIPYEYKTYKLMILPHSTWVDTGGGDDDGDDDDEEEEDCKCGANVRVGRNPLNQ